ncbi:MAG: hypothetical protein Q9167_002338 [Letrouitia subvulpina]
MLDDLKSQKAELAVAKNKMPSAVYYAKRRARAAAYHKKKDEEIRDAATALAIAAAALGPAAANPPSTVSLQPPASLLKFPLKEEGSYLCHQPIFVGASNQQQNSAKQGSTTTTGTAGQSPESQGVPADLAPRTGNNELAGSTGALYAGFAQSPGAGMFGPDGGVSLHVE